MSRCSNGLRVVLIWASLGLAASVSRADDSSKSIDLWPTPAEASVTPDSSTDVRSPLADNLTPWQRPLRAGVAPWSQRMLETQPVQSQPASNQPTAQWGIDAFGNPRPRPAFANQPSRNVQRASHDVAEADETMPAPRSAPAAMPHSAMSPSTPPATAMPPSAASPSDVRPPEAGGPACAGGSQGYWQNDYDFCPSGKWSFGAEFLLVRPHQASDTAYQVAPNGGSGSAIQNVNYDAPYDASFRTFVGWDIDCNQTLRFTFSHIFSDTLQSATVADGSIILTPLGAALNPGDSLNATQHVLLNLWDIEDIRKVQIPNCVCGGCPGWDLNWSWGVRIIDMEESIQNEVNGLDAGVFSQKSTFAGAGPRLGFEARRQLGQSRLASFFGADAALLLGGQTTTGSDTPGGLTSAQVVPDFDLRLGVCWQPTCNGSISVGWMFETYGDVTMLNGDTSLAFVSAPRTNSVSYDGLFVRGELHF